VLGLCVELACRVVQDEETRGFVESPSWEGGPPTICVRMIQSPIGLAHRRFLIGNPSDPLQRRCRPELDLREGWRWSARAAVPLAKLQRQACGTSIFLESAYCSPERHCA
jgi:hypothetical protein